MIIVEQVTRDKTNISTLFKYLDYQLKTKYFSIVLLSDVNVKDTIVSSRKYSMIIKVVRKTTRGSGPEENIQKIMQFWIIQY